MRFRIRGAAWSLEFSAEVIAGLVSFAQHGRNSLESVGQLYTADATSDPIRVDRMSRITPAWAGYSGVRLNMAAVKRERAEMYEKGLHCLGFWHTHPELRPAPSHDDIRLAKEHAEAGKSDFEGLVFAIVGTDSFPVGLGVWVHDGTNMWRAESEILGAGKGFT